VATASTSYVASTRVSTASRMTAGRTRPAFNRAVTVSTVGAVVAKPTATGVPPAADHASASRCSLSRAAPSRVSATEENGGGARFDCRGGVGEFTAHSHVT